MDLHCQMNGSNKACRPDEDAAGATDPSLWLHVHMRPHKQQHTLCTKPETSGISTSACRCTLLM